MSAVDPVRVRDGSDASGRPLTVGSSDFRILSRAGGAPLLDGRDSRKTAEAARRDNQVLVSEPYSRRFGASRGDRLVLATPKGPKSFRIAGVYRDFATRKELISTLRPAEVRRMIETGAAGDGMGPKLEACVRAVEHGVHEAHVIDGLTKHSLLMEIFTNTGVGTMIAPETPVDK